MEVLSPTSADYDRGTKFEECKSISTLIGYLLVAQDRLHVAHRTRHDHNTWHETVFDSLDTTIPLNSIGVSLDLHEVYEGLSFK